METQLGKLFTYISNFLSRERYFNSLDTFGNVEFIRHFCKSAVNIALNYEWGTDSVTPANGNRKPLFTFRWFNISVRNSETNPCEIVHSVWLGDWTHLSDVLYAAYYTLSVSRSAAWIWRFKCTVQMYCRRRGELYLGRRD